MAEQNAPVRTDAQDDRDYLFAMLAQLAALAGGQGEAALAVMLDAIVTAYREA